MIFARIFFISAAYYVAAQQYQYGSIDNITTGQYNTLGNSSTSTGDYVEISITYGTSFSEVPQLFIRPYRYSLNNAITGYQLEIVSPTTTGFSIRVIKTSNQNLYAVQLKYLAFVDAKKYVILDTITSPALLSTQTLTYNHYNINFVYAIPEIYSFVINSLPYSFTIKLLSLDMFQVIVQIDQIGLSEIRFQILLAEENAIWHYGNNYWTVINDLHNEPLIVSNADVPAQFQSNVLHFISTSQMSVSSSENLRWEQDIVLTGATLSFKVYAWGNSGYIDGTYDFLLVSTTYIIYPLTLQYFDQFEYQADVISDSISITLPQISTTFTSSQADVVINNLATGLVMNINMKCEFYYEHKYQFLGSDGDLQQYITDTNYCLYGLNMVQYSLKFDDFSRQDYKRLQLTITPTSITVIQLLHDVSQNEQYTLVQILIDSVY